MEGYPKPHSLSSDFSHFLGLDHLSENQKVWRLCWAISRSEAKPRPPKPFLSFQLEGWGGGSLSIRQPKKIGFSGSPLDIH